MKVAVIGANGQLGSDVYRAFQDNGDDGIELNHDTFEVNDFEKVDSVMHDIMPDLVVNTAAMHNVEVCEKDAEKAFAVNGIGVRNLAQSANRTGVYPHAY